MFNFNIKKTEIFWVAKMERFFPFTFAKFFERLFFYLLVIFLISIIFVFLGLLPEILVAKLTIICLVLWLLFLELHLFLELKIKNPNLGIKIVDAVLSPDNYNLAEFLSLPVLKIIENSIKYCKRRKISEINSAVLLYSFLKNSKEIKIIVFRLGLDILKLQENLKNYLEKMQKQKIENSFFSIDFQEVIKESLIISNEREHQRIGEKEILVALARHNEFFKKVLLDADLKEKDIEDITLWLDSIEKVFESTRKSWTSENLSRYGSLGKDWASGYTVTLNNFSIDWRDVVSKWRYREIIGHQKEVDVVQMILGRSSSTNVLIVGDSGTGRKSIVESLAQKCYLGTSLPELNNKRVVELDMVSLLSQIQNSEKLELMLSQIFEETLAAGNIILVIEDLHNFVGEGAQKPGSVDISGILSKYLPMHNFMFVGITDYNGLHNKIEDNSSFLSFFRKVEVSDVSESETIRILQNLALELEQKNKILVAYPAIREIVNLTGRYFPSMLFPKKAIDILDEAVVYLRSINEKVLLPHHIAKIISDKTEIPVGKMEFKEKEVLLNLENLIHQRIVNQEEAVKEISTAMRRARAGISSKKRPMGTFLFLGPTGVGKTETSKALAEIYFGSQAFKGSDRAGSSGSEEKMIRIDMSEFQSISDIPRLIGATSPVEIQGLLTTPVRETPFSLILLDEIEKSHPDILNLFLQVLDEGHITDGQGRKVVFTNTIIICTSNAGAENIFETIESGKKIEKDKLLDMLFEKRLFKPEFINRFDATVVFKPLTKENLLDIARLMLGSLKNNLQEKEIELIVTESLLEKIVGLSYKPAFGAREMRRVIQNTVESSVAQALLSDKIIKGSKIEIDSESFEVIVNPEA
ncbi:MAG: ATP-dependent Clp protease ATP-binding subunit [Candidatus Staskawiczbacteria bacterium]|nr:ATP-dependent Clp protease ATP-binding subunit [Candidatus Staskawiczbacteria bacterium]